MLSAIDPLAVVRSAPQAALRGVLPVALPRPWRVPVQRGALAAQRLAWLGVLGALLLLAPPVQAQDAQAAPLKAESPYFFVQGAQPGVEALPLKRTDVHAHVSGVIADVVVTQHYRNEGQVPIEARYIFPGGTHAAVNGMVVRVGKRRVVAQIREKQAARIEYDAARREGKTAALLEHTAPTCSRCTSPTSCPATRWTWSCATTSCWCPPTGSTSSFSPRSWDRAMRSTLRCFACCAAPEGASPLGRPAAPRRRQNEPR